VWLPNVVNDKDIRVRIELNDQKEKVYISRPHIGNVGERAGKLYLIHLKEYVSEMGFDVDEIDTQLHEAFKISAVKSKAHVDEIMRGLKNEH